MTKLTKDQLEAMKVAELRALAKEQDHEALTGYSKMTKGDLVTALSTAMGIGEEAPAPKAEKKPVAAAKKPAPAGKKKEKEPKVRTKEELKAELKTVQQRKKDALAAGNHTAVKAYRHRIRKLNRAIRAAAK